MNKILLLAFAGLTLAGCSDEERREQRSHIQSRLPAGCTITDLGQYAQFDHLVMIRCPDSTVTTQGEFKVGKNPRRVFAVVARPL